MAICGGCGAETRRTRMVFDEKNVFRKEECDKCNPNSFEPQWLTARGVMGWEAYPEKYTKIHLPDGRVGYRAKDEFRQDTEDRIRRGSVEEEKKYQAALEKKRATRRTTPMTEDEIRQRVERVRAIYEQRTEESNQRWNSAVNEWTN